MKTLSEDEECIDRNARTVDFPLLAREIDGNRLVYLDSAATSLTPVQVVSEISRYYLEVGANIHRGKHYLSEEASVAYEEGRYKVARFIGAAGNEIVFVRNTTEALNLVACGLKLRTEDRVIAFTDSHHSAYLPWKRIATTTLVRTDARGVVDLEHYKDLLRLGAKVVCLTHCSNVSGIYVPLDEMATMAKEAGAIVVVDAAQSVPHRRLDVTRQNIDFLAFSGHKMLGPTGIGVLYGKHDSLENLSPALVGGGMVDWVDAANFRVRKIPHRFEAGTPHISGVYGLIAAIKYLERIGLNRVQAHDQGLGRLLLSEALRRDYLDVIAPGEESSERCAMVSMKMTRHHDPGDIARMLSDSYGVMCRSGHMCAQPFVDYVAGGQILRASAYVYNTKQDVMDLFLGLDEINRAFGC